MAAAAVASLAPLVARVPGDCTTAVADVEANTSLEPGKRLTRAMLTPSCHLGHLVCSPEEEVLNGRAERCRAGCGDVWVRYSCETVPARFAPGPRHVWPGLWMRAYVSCQRVQPSTY